MQKQFTFKFSDFADNINDIKMQDGFDAEFFVEIKNKIFSEYLFNCEIKGGYIILDKIKFLEKYQLQIENKTFLIKKIVWDELKEADQIAVFVCTAGDVIDKLSTKFMSEGNFVEGYMIDEMGANIVESAVDEIQKQLRDDVKSIGFNISNRYSPGYCGWHVSAQHDLFSLFPENFTEVTLTESALMYPIKSVSGIIGIGKNIEEKDYKCNVRAEKNCLYKGRLRN